LLEEKNEVEEILEKAEEKKYVTIASRCTALSLKQI
jgi:hypothetical protein